MLNLLENEIHKQEEDEREWLSRELQSVENSKQRLKDIAEKRKHLMI